ncbi:hypothetical protein JCM6882_001698 [Rhodosporidiobolus microsporus]
MGGASGALINKTARASTPDEVLNRYIFFCGFVLSAAGGLHGFNNSNMSGIMKASCGMHAFKESFKFAQYSATALADIQGWVTSSIVIGGLIGALIAAPITDRFGRKKTLYACGLLYTIGCIVQIVTSTNINQQIGGRALQGFGGGIASVCGTAYLAEIAPKAIRGLLGSLFGTNTMFGIAAGYWSNYIAILHISDNSPWQWRLALIVQMIPGAMILFLLPLVPESPRWLAVQGRTDEALAVLVKLRKLPAEHDFVVQEFSDIVGGVEQERAAGKASWIGAFRELWSDNTMMRRFIVVMLIQIGYNFSGGNSITYYQTTILNSVGIQGNDAYLFSGIYGLIKVLALFVYAIYCTEHFGRRKTLLIGGSLDMLCVMWIAIYLGALEGNKPGGWVSVAALCLFALGYGISWAPNSYNVSAEVFPNQVRAKFTSLAMGLQYLVNFLIVRYFPNMSANITPKGPFIMFACVSAAILLFMFFALPEVKGVAIEHIAPLFSSPLLANGLRSSRLNRSARDREAADAATVTDGKTKGEVRHIEDGKDEMEKGSESGAATPRV